MVVSGLCLWDSSGGCCRVELTLTGEKLLASSVSLLSGVSVMEQFTHAPDVVCDSSRH